MKIDKFFKGVGLIVLSTLFLYSCIQPEPLNVEADILSVEVEGVELLRPARLHSNSIELPIGGWEDLTKVELRFTLSPGATIAYQGQEPIDYSAPLNYVVTSEDGQWHKSYEVRFTPAGGLPSLYSFEHVRLQQGKFEVFYEPADGGDGMEWQSPNLGFAITAGDAPPSDYPVSQSVEGYKGNCAKIVTKSTGPLGQIFGMPLATGSLFIGSLDTGNIMTAPLQSTRFGTPIGRKPIYLTGYYRYTAGEKYTNKRNEVQPDKRDIFDLYAIVYEVTEEVHYLDGTNSLTHPNIVLMARIDDAKESEEWVRFALPFKEVNGRDIDAEKLANKGYNFSIVISSSKDGANFNGAVGSVLHIDELSLFFE